MTDKAKHARKGGFKAKKSAFAVAVTAICCVLLAGGTLAYFTAENTAHNVITSGGVDIQLNEWADADKTIPFEDVEGLMPGQSETKVVEVENIGASDAWVRVKVGKSFTVAGAELDASVVVLDLPNQDNPSDYWVYNEEDGYWYYTKPLAPGAVTAEPLFNSVYLKSGTGNEYQNGSVSVTVYAQAVQTVNNGATALEAAGWPEE